MITATSKLSPEDARERLERYTSNHSSFLNRANASKPLVGEIEENHFKVWLYGDSVIPRFEGILLPDKEGSRIEGKLKVQKFHSFITEITIFIFVGLVYRIFFDDWKDKVWSALILFGIAFVKLAFSYIKRYDRAKELTKILGHIFLTRIAAALLIIPFSAGIVLYES